MCYRPGVIHRWNRSYRGAFLSRLGAAKRDANICQWKLVRARCRGSFTHSEEQHVPQKRFSCRHRYHGSFFSGCWLGACLAFTCQMLMACNPGWLAAWVLCTCLVLCVLIGAALLWMRLVAICMAAWDQQVSIADTVCGICLCALRSGNDVAALAVAGLTAPALRQRCSITLLFLFPIPFHAKVTAS